MKEAYSILTTAYAAPIAYYKLLAQGACLVEACDSFQKQTFRNRCRIITPNGVEDLTIPVEQGAKQDCPIREVRISLHNHWWTRHLQALQSAYGKTPFYEFYIEDLISFYEGKRYDFLFDFNWHLMERIASLIHLNLNIEKTDTYIREYTSFSDYRFSIQPKRSALDLPCFQIAPYYHRFSPASDIPFWSISIFDLLFNMGPESLLILTAS